MQSKIFFIVISTIVAVRFIGKHVEDSYRSGSVRYGAHNQQTHNITEQALRLGRIIRQENTTGRLIQNIRKCGETTVIEEDADTEQFVVDLFLDLGGKEILFAIPFMKAYFELHFKRWMNHEYEDLETYFYSISIQTGGKRRSRRATATGICRKSYHCPPEPEFTFPDRRVLRDRKSSLGDFIEELQEAKFEKPSFAYKLDSTQVGTLTIYAAKFEQEISTAWSDLSYMSVTTTGDAGEAEVSPVVKCKTQECNIQRDAIISLLDQFGVDYDEKSHECVWDGILCDGRKVVNQIWIENKNERKKKFPEECLQLTELTSLVFRNNAITGTIPVGLSKLNKLKILSIEFNEMTGTIPTTLGLLPNLSELKLNQNQLIGGIPSEIGNAESLRILDISRNAELGGQIPTELGNLANLETLIMYKSAIVGEITSAFASLENLKEILLGDNKLVGNVNNLSQLKHLQVIDLANNELTGILPSTISSEMRILNLYNNQFSGEINDSIADLNLLTELILGKNDMYGSIPTQIGSLSKLSIFDIGDNLFSGQLPSELANLNELEVINLSGNNDLTGSANFLCGTPVMYAIDEGNIEICQ